MQSSSISASSDSSSSPKTAVPKVGAVGKGPAKRIWAEMVA